MDVRRNGLSTYRIEVDASYDYDGYIVFRDGKNILFREKFEPETTVTERSIPAEVMEYAKAGKKFQWGLEFGQEGPQEERHDQGQAALQVARAEVRPRPGEEPRPQGRPQPDRADA